LANAPALPETQRLYKRLQELGIKPVILTGRREDKRESTAKNLADVGYTGYEKLLLKYAPSAVVVDSIDLLPLLLLIVFVSTTKIKKKKKTVRMRVTIGRIYIYMQASGRQGDCGGVQVRRAEEAGGRRVRHRRQHRRPVD